MFAHLGRASALVLAAALGVATLGTAPTLAAQPNTTGDSQTLFAYGHTDSPKAFWDSATKNLTLKATQGQSVVPLEDATHWLHRAYSGAEEKTQFYYMTVPDQPSYSFLGKPGDQLYAGFAENSVGSDQPALWIGFGADAAVPVEQFRDQAFMLQLVDFQGPGDMEIFRRGFGDDASSIRRYLSSKDMDYRATMLTAGSHTHLVTTFTKPGRYQMTYRTALRGVNGQYVYSPTQVMTWQVGGDNPSKRAVANIAEAWNGLPQGTATTQFKPSFTVSPKTGSEPLTHFEFTTGNSADQGTAIFTIDGYEMAQVPLSGGRASWDEMIGSDTSAFNVIYVPAAGSQTPQWVSEAINAKTGSEAKTVTAVATKFPQATKQTGTVKTFSDRKATSGKVSLSSKQNGESVTVTVMPTDPTMELDVVGGFGNSLKDATVACPVDFHSGPHSRSFTVESEYLEWCKGSPHFKVIPAPENSGVAAVSFDGSEESPSFDFRGTFPASQQTAPEEAPAETPEENDQPATPSQPTVQKDPSDDEDDVPTGGKFIEQEGGLAWSDPSKIFDHDFSGLFNVGTDEKGEKPKTQGKEPSHTGTKPEESSSNTQQMTHDGEEIFGDAVTISDGHIDVGPFQMPDGSLKLLVKDDSRQHQKKTVLRDPAKVTLKAEVAAHQRGKYVFGDPSFDFLGDKQSLYVISQTQVQGVVWPGFSTEHLPNTVFPKGATITVSPESMPQGAHVWAFTDSFGKLAQKYVDASAQEGGGTVTGANTHLHVNWVFTKPGTYRFAVSAKASNAQGQEVSAPATQLTLVVKDPNQADPDPGNTDPKQPDPNQAKELEPSQSGQGQSGTDELQSGAEQSQSGAEPPQSGQKKPSQEDFDPKAPAAPTNAPLGAGPSGQGLTVEQCIPTQVKKEVPASQAQASVGGSYTIPANTHVHPNWVFTQAGTYKVIIRQSATKDGKTLSGRSTLTFNVGGQGNANEGHFDVGAMIQNGQFIPVIKDDRAQPAQWVKPESLTFGLGEASVATAPAGIEFVAKAGEKIWMIGSSQVPGVPWVGANTMHPSLGGNTPVTWTLESVQGPGSVAVFTSGNFGQAVGERWFSGSASGGSGDVIEENGKYYRMEWVGKTPSGKDCQLSAEQLSALQGGGAGGNLARTGATGQELICLVALLALSGTLALAATRRRRQERAY